ncbi:MAG: GIY-YIG nuclease family protein, partial [Patescibacteria group bacterium]
MNFSNLKEKASNLPQLPGSYIFKDKKKKVIYVGKAKNLKSRVGSYFNIKLDASSKTAALVKQINDIEFIEVESEFEALILEAELI